MMELASALSDPLAWARVFRNCSEPERAMVPMFSTNSASVMPMPVSAMVSTPASLSRVMVISRGRSGEGMARPLLWAKRSLSSASEALDTSSRKNISRCVYSEWVMMCSSFLTSVLNSYWRPAAPGAVVSDMRPPRECRFRYYPERKGRNGALRDGFAFWSRPRRGRSCDFEQQGNMPNWTRSRSYEPAPGRRETTKARGGFAPRAAKHVERLQGSAVVPDVKTPNDGLPHMGP